MRGKVLVAMSGGVDSSVAALLLREAGYQVAGALMRTFNDDQPCDTSGEARINACCGTSAITDARRVAAHLGIPFYVLDYEETFRRMVIDEFVEQYQAGRTPNPCISCNNRVKFHHFYRYAMGLGMDHIATGHYARVARDTKSGRFFLERGQDHNKDQSYVLYGLEQEVLARLVLPLSDLPKAEVRSRALKAGLNVAEKPDSQEICFVTRGDYRDFLRRQGVPEHPGPFVNKAGDVLGTHRGIPFYTVGQRKGLNLALGEPHYVTAIDPVENRIILGPKRETTSRAFEFDQILWSRLTPEMVGETLSRGAVQIRAHHPPVPCHFHFHPEIGGGTIRVSLDTPAESVCPGQSAVIYQDGGIALGGRITRSFA